ncbi:MAG: Na(+)-translocating NADH-quinone reductase subunit A [Bacteroidales bacterium]|nr:Na(+)-translocating NADH-quinone reductase subunit A [Bacteroidales bacterium]
MTQVIKIKQGLDIKLKGKAERAVSCQEPESFALQPTDFVGLNPRLLVSEGDQVKVGTTLFCDKSDERILFTAPVSGTVNEVRRGPKRLLEAVVVQSDKQLDTQYFEFGKPTKESITRSLLETGLWPMIRQRPYGTIAKPDDKPKAFFVSAFDTAPLAPDMDFLAERFPDSLQKGLEVLSILCDNKLHLCIHSEKTKSEVLLKAKNATLHTFSGPHPSGNVGTQINRICPINKGDIVWHCGLPEVINIGNFFRTGRLDFSRLYAVAGSGLLHPQYCLTKLGASVAALTDNNLKDSHQRLVSGNVLTGHAITENDFIGFYHSMLSVIPEGDQRHEMLGWIWPGFKKFSMSRTFPSAFIPNVLQPDFELDTNLHGEERAFVMTGEFEKVFPFDIFPLQLIKACIIGDIDLMENLGIYEVEPEDFALCEFVDTSKTDIQAIIRNGLEILRKENG